MISQTPLKKSDSSPYDINYCCNLPIAIFLNLEKGLLSAEIQYLKVTSIEFKFLELLCCYTTLLESVAIFSK